jgi:hypothetical protein
MGSNTVIPLQEPAEPPTAVPLRADSQDDSSKDVNPPATSAEPAIEKVDHSTVLASEDYSVFTVGQKRAIIFAGSFAAWFSPMTGSIYFPALDRIGEDLGVSNSAMSITVTTYLIMQGLALVSPTQLDVARLTFSASPST